MAYVYALTDPDGAIRYVGKTVRDPAYRLRIHINEARRGSHRHCHRWLKRLMASGQEPRVLVLHITETEEDAFYLERQEVSRFRAVGARLTNHTDGGEGPSGWKHTPEQCAAIAARQRGTKHSSEHKARISAGLKASYLDPKNREKRSKGLRGRPRSPETRARIGEGNKGKPRTEEYKARVSALLRGRTQSAETRQKRSESLKRAYDENPELRAKLSVAKRGNKNALGHKQTDEHRAKLRAAWARRREMGASRWP